MWVKYNGNPISNNTSDCTSRAIGVALDIPWEKAYTLLCAQGFLMGLMPLDNDVLWGSLLRQHGFKRYLAPDEGVTVKEFCEEHPYGVYVLKAHNHVLTVVDSRYYDSWDSGDEPVIYYWTKVEDKTNNHRF